MKKFEMPVIEVEVLAVKDVVATDNETNYGDEIPF